MAIWLDDSFLNMSMEDICFIASNLLLSPYCDGVCCLTIFVAQTLLLFIFLYSLFLLSASSVPPVPIGRKLKGDGMKGMVNAKKKLYYQTCTTYRRIHLFYGAYVSICNSIFNCTLKIFSLKHVFRRSIKTFGV
jgi:hypothetical protein